MNDLSRLVHDIEAEARMTASWTGRDRFAPAIMAAMASVPREQFVPVESRAYAFDNGPLPIGHGQTISQPYIVALMTDLLEPEPGDVILEIGTGSGYQTAVLATLVRHVYSCEIIPELAEAARERLAVLGYDNVSVRAGDGGDGWPEHAPYDAIIVTAAAPSIPEPLIAQLKPSGRMVIPVGLPYAYQELQLLTKEADNSVTTRHILGVSFVPLTGKHRA
jgi:protein-L-isoaspartate(D-aspartate) O-methyltransferase